MRCRLEDLLTFKFSVGAIEDKIDDEVHEAKEPKEDGKGTGVADVEGDKKANDVEKVSDIDADGNDEANKRGKEVADVEGDKKAIDVATGNTVADDVKQGSDIEDEWSSENILEGEVKLQNGGEDMDAENKGKGEKGTKGGKNGSENDGKVQSVESGKNKGEKGAKDDTQVEGLSLGSQVRASSYECSDFDSNANVEGIASFQYSIETSDENYDSILPDLEEAILNTIYGSTLTCLFINKSSHRALQDNSSKEGLVSQRKTQFSQVTRIDSSPDDTLSGKLGDSLVQRYNVNLQFLT